MEEGEGQRFREASGVDRDGEVEPQNEETTEPSCVAYVIRKPLQPPHRFHSTLELPVNPPWLSLHHPGSGVA